VGEALSGWPFTFSAMTLTRRILALGLAAIAAIWFVLGIAESWPDLRSMFAVTVLATMILLLSIACVISSRPMKIIGCITGVLLAYREFLMLANSNIDLRETIRMPYGWIGPCLLALFIVSACVSLAGWRNPRRT
jgi:hypothetical protein